MISKVIKGHIRSSNFQNNSYAIYHIFKDQSLKKYFQECQNNEDINFS